jgi:hypothetical protein
VHHPKLHREGWALVGNGDGTFRPVPPGHLENPKTGLSPEEYLRRRVLAIAERKKRKGSMTSYSGAAPPTL